MKGICLLASSTIMFLTACTTSLAPGASRPATPNASIDFFAVNLRVALALKRETQTLPTTWDHAILTVASSRLKLPVVRNFATESATLVADVSVPQGDATVSVLLTNGGLHVATGSSTASLQAGMNNIYINLKTLLDFSGSISAS